MLNWLSSISDQPTATLIGAIIGAVATAIVAVFTVLIKDYLIPLITEKRLIKNKTTEAFKDYANPLILSSISFLYRTKEIFDSGDFLLDEIPKNDYNEYKYLSTVYRICVLLGWIRAIKIELSHIKVKNTKEFNKIEDALCQFEKSLADGEHIELSRLEQLCRIWHLDYPKVSDKTKKYLGTQIEILIDTATYNEKVDVPTDLNEILQFKLTRKVSDLICTESKLALLSDAILKESLSTSLKEMSRVESWIYRDWQSAIGELMIKLNNTEQGRKYDVVSYLEFEKMWFDGDSNTKKWVNRIEALFKNLDTKIEDRFDARKHQLINTYNSTISLIKVFSKVSKSNVDITKTALKNLEGNI